MFPVVNGHRLRDPELDEFRKLTANLRQYLSVEHADDGTHRIGYWEPYPVVWAASTAPTLGNGQLTGRTMRVGETVFYAVHLVFGSTTNGGSGTWFFSVPEPSTGLLLNVASTIGIDASPAGYYPAVAVVSGSSIGFNVADANGPWDASTPITWATGDGLIVSGHYEIEG
jgi:hypothetical protein